MSEDFVVAEQVERGDRPRVVRMSIRLLQELGAVLLHEPHRAAHELVHVGVRERRRGLRVAEHGEQLVEARRRPLLLLLRRRRRRWIRHNGAFAGLGGDRLQLAPLLRVDVVDEARKERFVYDLRVGRKCSRVERVTSCERAKKS